MGVPALPIEWLENAVIANPHGCGASVRYGEGAESILTAFGALDEGDVIKAVAALGEESEVVFHARWATHGKVDAPNLHPFPLHTEAGDVFGYLAHNGVVNIATLNDDFSDSWHLARLMERTYGEGLTRLLPRARWRRKFSARWGRSNKFAVMTHAGTTLINAEAGLWRDGVWASNNSAFSASRKVWTLGGQFYGCDDGSDYVWDNDETDYAKSIRAVRGACSDSGPSALTNLRRSALKTALSDAAGRLYDEAGDGVSENQAYAFMYDLRAAESVGDIESLLHDYTGEEVARVIYALVAQAAYAQDRIESAESELSALAGGMEPQEDECQA
jgi:hypothetical protein